MLSIANRMRYNKTCGILQNDKWFEDEELDEKVIIYTDKAHFWRNGG